MGMRPIEVVYEFEKAAGDLESFEVRINPDDMSLIQGIAPDELPEWTRLGNSKCPHCPLDEAEHPHCPAAAAIVGVTQFSDAYKSHDKITTQVKTEDRVIVTRDPAQVVFGSLIGLITATSGCPYMAYFRPMARFHLPFANVDETIYRVFSMYLLAQYYRQKRGETADFHLSGLKKIYEEVEVVNEHMTERLRSAVHTDASLNAVIALDTFAKTMLALIDEQIEEVEYLFKPFLDKPS